jgi:hypothetical protein
MAMFSKVEQTWKRCLLDMFLDWTSGNNAWPWKQNHYLDLLGRKFVSATMFARVGKH